MKIENVHWEDIVDYLRIPCPLCGGDDIILEYMKEDDYNAKYREDGYIFQCPRCEHVMSFSECERFRKELK